MQSVAANPQDRQALAILHGLGGHFVLCDGKRPVWRNWNSRRPSLDVVQYHNAGAALGIGPHSVETSALDVDLGDIGELIDEYPPLTALDTPRGKHLYYRDSEPRGNSQWSAYGCRGDVRSAKGYLCLYEGGAARLAHALTMQPRDVGLWPRDLFEAAGVEAPRAAEPSHDGGPASRFQYRGGPVVDLATVEIGGRRNALFDVVRFWAYGEARGHNLRQWVMKVDRYGLEHNQRFRRPLPDQRVLCQVTRSVATWVWDGGGPIDHSPPVQRRRAQKLGRMRRSKTAERDRAIVEAVRGGQSMRSVERAYGLSHGMARHILSRPQEPPNPQGALSI